MRAATRHEHAQLRARYAMKREAIGPGVAVQILAFGRNAYPAIVEVAGPRLVRVEFRRRGGGHLYRALPYAEIYVDGALQRLRSERAAVPDPASLEQP